MCAESGLSANCCALPIVSSYFFGEEGKEEEEKKMKEKVKKGKKTLMTIGILGWSGSSL